MYLNPGKEPSTMTPHEIEAKISYADQMEVYDKFLMCFDPKKELKSSDMSHSGSSDDDGDEERKDKKHKKLKDKIVGDGKPGVLHFDERKFREIRYGFVASTLKASVSEASAVLIM